MTDPEYADRTYIEPLTAESVEAILEQECPDAVLPYGRRPDRAESGRRARQGRGVRTGSAFG